MLGELLNGFDCALMNKEMIKKGQTQCGMIDDARLLILQWTALLPHKLRGTKPTRWEGVQGGQGTSYLKYLRDRTTFQDPRRYIVTPLTSTIM